MRTTLTRIIMAVLAIAALSTYTAPSASAGDDLPRTGVLPDTVMVSGRYEATGYLGGFFGRERITVREAFIGSALFETGDRLTGLTRDGSCAGDFFFFMETLVHERRDDGAVLVSIVANTWNDCPFVPGPDGWSEEFAWVAPGESVSVDLLARSSDGSVTVSAIFTNIWTPKIDTSRLRRPRMDLWNRYRLNLGMDRVATATVVEEEPQIDESPKIDTSKIDTTVANISVPTPQAPLDADRDESSEADVIIITDLVDLVDLVNPTITIPITFGASFDF